MKSIKRALIGASLTLLTSCTTKLPPPPGNNHLDAGWYMFDCDAIYDEGLCQVTTIPVGYHVNLLESFAGDFELHRTKTRNEVVIQNANVDYESLKRTFKGDGYLYGANQGKGLATSWIRRTRHHREDRPWILRPATDREFRKAKERLVQRNEWPFNE